METKHNLAARAAHWSAAHRRLAVFGWIGLVVVALAIGSAVGMNTLADEDLGNGDSRRADRVLADAGFADRATEQVLVQPRTGKLTIVDPRFRRAVSDVVARLQGLRYVTDIKSPLLAVNGGQISADRGSALVTFDIQGDSEQTEERVGPIQDAVAGVQAKHPSLRIEQFGDASADKAISKQFEEDFAKAETLSLPITLIILIIAFGALVAAGLPLLLGLSAVILTLGVLAPLSQLFPVDEAISSVILLVGLAVGIDYSLFYIRRERDERAAGREPEDALERAAATSGRAVLVSGFTVVVAMSGMYLTGNATFQSFATGTIIVVAAAMVGSVTVLPAALSKLGDRIDKGRVPFLGRRRREAEGGFWAAIVDRVLHRPWVAVILGGGLLVFLALPTLRLHTENSGIDGLPHELPVIQTFDRIEAAFPGGPLPAIVAVKARDVTTPEVTEAIGALRTRALDTHLMQEPIATTVSDDKTVALVEVPLAGDGTDATSNRALAALREDIIPATVGRVAEEAPVTGLTAGSKDFNDQMKSRAPYVFAFVLSLAFLLLMVTFRSIVIPLKAVVLNLLSVGAAYGVLVWIFQDGHLESLLGFTSIGGITSWLPLFLFVILFGLSMDYHVFILSRVKEGHDRGMTTDEAVSHGIKATASVVTSAAVVMVAVFAIFATLSSIDFKQMGVGLALAVLIDATLVRAVLLPASMKLLGEWNWYFPRWLEWIPKVALEEGPSVVREGDLDLVSTRRDRTLTVTARGTLDLRTAPALNARLLAEEDGAELVVLDLRAVTFVDSSGLRELVAANQRARRRQGRFVVVRGEDTAIAHVLATTKLDTAFETQEGS